MLAKHNLSNNARLAEQLTVEPGWELAVETVLADYLEAVCVVNQIDALVDAVQELTAGNVTLFDYANSSAAANVSSSSPSY